MYNYVCVVLEVKSAINGFKIGEFGENMAINKIK
jgi:hypothetical protein